nr:hypothetical protein [Tanacetum cinerariifolium]
MDLFAFIHASDPTKVRVVEQERDEDEPRLLETTVGRTVMLLSVAPDRAENTIVEDAAPMQSRRQGKRKSMVVDASGASHPPKKLKEDHETSSGASVGDSSYHSGTNVAKAEVDSLIRSFALITTTVTTTTLTVGPTSVTKEKLVEPSLFGVGSSSTGGSDPITGVFLDLTGNDFLIGDICTVINLDTDIQKTYVPQCSVTNGSRLNDDHIYHEMVDKFAPPKFFTSIHGMDHARLFTEFNVRAARKMSLGVEVRMRAGYNIKDKMRLKSVVNEQAALLKVREKEIENLKAQLSLREAEATKAIRLRAQAYKHETIERSLRDETNALKERNAILEKERDALDRQPNVDQLIVPIHSSSNKVVIGATALSHALDASNSRVRKNRENITDHRSVLHDIFVQLAEPFSTAALTGMEGTSDVLPATAITTALSTTLSLISTVNPIFIDDYDFVNADDQAIAGEDVASFPNVDDAELRIP